MFHENKMGSIIRSTGTVFYSLLYLNSRQAFNGLKYVYSVISEIVDSLPGNTKNRESTHSWTARVRSGHPCAGGLPLNYNFEYEKCPKYCTTGSSYCSRWHLSRWNIYSSYILLHVCTEIPQRPLTRFLFGSFRPVLIRMHI